MGGITNRRAHKILDCGKKKIFKRNKQKDGEITDGWEVMVLKLHPGGER